MDDFDDRRLITLAKEGSADAFEVLVGRHYETMYKMAFKFCADREDAEDITQEACIRMARGIHGFRFDSSFTTWMYRLVVNTAKDQFRKNGRHAGSSDGLDQISFKNPQENELYARQVLAEVHKLPDGERDALILVMSEGLSHKEAADILDCKENTVSWRIHEARKKLAAIFGKERDHG